MMPACETSIRIARALLPIGLLTGNDNLVPAETILRKMSRRKMSPSPLVSKDTQPTHVSSKLQARAYDQPSSDVWLFAITW